MNVTLQPSVRAEIARLEAAKPDPRFDPEGFRLVNDEIMRLIEQNRKWGDAHRYDRKIV